MGPYGQLAVHSDQPSIQLYCAAHLYPIGPALGAVHNAGAAVCLETQQLPNGPQLDPQVWIEPGQDYLHQIRWEFTPHDPTTFELIIYAGIDCRFIDSADWLGCEPHSACFRSRLPTSLMASSRIQSSDRDPKPAWGIGQPRLVRLQKSSVIAKPSCWV